MKTDCLIFIIPTFVIFILSSCQEGDIHTPGTGRIQLEAETTSGLIFSVSGRMAKANDLVFNSGTIKGREIVFDGDLDDGNSVSITEEKIFSIDYAAGQFSPEINLEVTSGLYRDVYLGIELEDDGVTIAIVLDGSYTNSDGTLIPLKFAFMSGEVFEASFQELAINENDQLTAIIKFDAIRWFNTITASQLDEAEITEGVLLINETTNADIYDIVADQIDYATQIRFE